MMNAQQKILGFKTEPYKFLSNMAPVSIFYERLFYKSVEHAYQASKSLDLKFRHDIQKCNDGYAAKNWAKGIVVRQDFHDIKLNLMKDFLRQKFTQEPFKYKLKLTGEAYIEETNWWGDTYWGVCKGKGDNHLGKLIMLIREEL